VNLAHGSAAAKNRRFFANRGTADGFVDVDRKSKGQTRDERSGLENNEIPPLARVCLRTRDLLDNMVIGQDASM
jgi:hypothetical protein